MRRLLKTAQRLLDHQGRGHTAPPFVFVAMLTATLSASSLTPDQPPARTPPGVLHSIEVEGDGDRVVVTLRADRPITGELQQTSEGRTRLFIDLQGVEPHVPLVTPVNRGPLLRIRAALHSADPLITRVVLDVSKVAATRIESDAAGNLLRVVIGEGEEMPGLTVKAGLEPGPAAADPGVTPGDKTWCTEFAERVSALLNDKSALTSQPAMRAALAQWEKLEQEAKARSVGPALQSVHFILQEAVRLGRIGSSYYNARDFERASAAQAGASLMLETAQTRLEQLQ